MAPGYGQPDWDEEEWEDEDRDSPQDIDLHEDDDDETPTVPCPSCQAEIPDFADRCPYCGDWVSQGGKTRRSPWLIVLAIVVLAVFLFWSLG